MRLLTPLAVLVSLASTRDPANYDSYQVLRVKTGPKLAEIEQKLSGIDYDEWNTVVNKHIDIAIPPSQVVSLKALGLDYHVMHGDLGASIAAELAVSVVWKRQVDDLAWYDSYHPYEEHKAYVEALHEAFPDNSELVSWGPRTKAEISFIFTYGGLLGPASQLCCGTEQSREWTVALAGPIRVIYENPGSLDSQVVEYLTLQNIQGYGVDNTTTGFVESYDVYSFPFVRLP